MLWILGPYVFTGRSPGAVLVAPLAGSNALTYASINGTILAIAFAAVLGFALIVFQSIDTMRRELVDHANELVAEHRLHNATFFGGREDLDALSALPFRERLDVLRNLTHAFDQELGDRDTIAANDLERRGRLLIGGIQELLMNDSPFARGPLADENEVRRWYPEAHQGVVMLQWALNPDHASLFSHDDLTAAADEPEASQLRSVLDVAPLPSHIRARFEKQMSHHTRLLEELRGRVNAYEGGIIDIDRRLNRLDRYRRRATRPKLEVALLLLAVVVVFVCGVALPMIDPQTPKLVSAVLPVTTYAVALLAGCTYMWRNNTR